VGKYHRRVSLGNHHLIVDPRDGRALPAQLEGERLAFVARAVPATGYCMLLLEPSADLPPAAVAAAAPERTVSHRDGELEIGATGGVAGLRTAAGNWRGAAGRDLFGFQYRRYADGSFERRKYHLPYPGSKGLSARLTLASGSAEILQGPARSLLRWKESLPLPEGTFGLEWTAWPDPVSGAVRLRVMLRNKPATLELEAGGFELGAAFDDVLFDGEGGRYRPPIWFPEKGMTSTP
jgi:hypothetical protein